MQEVSLPSYVSGLRSYTVALVHHPLRLVVDHLAVIVALPRTVVLLERRTPGINAKNFLWYVS